MYITLILAAAQALTMSQRVGVDMCLRESNRSTTLCEMAIRDVADLGDADLTARLQARLDQNQPPRPTLGQWLLDTLSAPDSTTVVQTPQGRARVRVWMSRDGRRSSVRVD